MSYVCLLMGFSGWDARTYLSVGHYQDLILAAWLVGGIRLSVLRLFCGELIQILHCHFLPIHLSHTSPILVFKQDISLDIQVQPN